MNRTLNIPIFIVAAGLCLTSGRAFAQERPAHDGKVAVFGTLHAHSKLSGDVSNSKGLTPTEAFDYARVHGLDFLGISDHHKHPDGPGGSKFHLEDHEYDSLVQAAESINSQHAGTFVAIPGIEWGTVATGNHIGIYGAPILPPDSIDDDDYDELFPWIKANALFAQCNHPYGWGNEGHRDKDVGNYGKDKAAYASTADFVGAADPALHLMSVICWTPKGLQNSDEFPHREVSSKALKEYRRNLNYGLHLSPSGSQDTHGANHGAASAARTGVWVDEFSMAGIAEAITSNRAFATEDDELAVAIQVEHDGKTYWMGETVPLGAEEAEVTLIIHVSQASAHSGPAESGAAYWATIHSDSDGIGGRQAAEWDTLDLSAGAEDYSVTVPVVAGEYFFLEVTEQVGEDNPLGDGYDEHGMDGSEGPDGFRDDLRDSAWTSPIWFAAVAQQSGEFVWSKNSSLYHDHDCWVVSKIGSANRREGDAPSGKTKHDCPQ